MSRGAVWSRTLAAVLLGACTSSKAVEVSSAEALAHALSRARPGEVIRVAPGEYEGVAIVGFHGSATIASADPAHEAVFTDLTIRDSSGLVLQGLDLAVPYAPFGSGGNAACHFQVLKSHGIELRGLKVHGPPEGTLATDICGLMVRSSDHVTLENSDFSHLHNGFQHIDDNFLVVRGNYFHNLWDDGIRGGGSSNVLIENNTCESNHPDANDKDHPDCIQFWTANTTASAHDITIKNNRYYRGAGQPVQGIFVRDNDLKYPFIRLVIEGNDIEGSLWHGIAVDGAVDPVIDGNRVCGYADQLSWIMVRDTKGAVVSRNRSTAIKYLNSGASRDSHNVTGEWCRPADSDSAKKH